jgi:hypothetical protein
VADISTVAMPGGANAANWTAGFSQGTVSITLTAVGSTGILNGDEIILDQSNDLNDTGGFVICDSNGGAGPNSSGSTVCMANTVGNGNIGRNYSGQSHSQQQRVVVTAGCASTCTGAGPFTLTISPGLYANNWGGTGRTTGAWFVKPVRYVGVENMTIDHSNTSSSAGMTFYDCSQCWVKNVRSLKVNNEHVLIYNGSRVEVRDSYFYGVLTAQSQSYGILLFPASDCLVENNVFQQITSPILSGGAGNVFAYNFSTDNLVSGGTYNQGSYASHDVGNYMNLWEGNVMNSIFTDQLHGTSGLITLFRNWLNGYDWNTINGPATHPVNQTYPIDFDSYSRGMNVIGNVLGTPGYHNNYEAYAPNSYTATQCNQSLFELGWGGGLCSNQQGVLGDTSVRSTLMRWGNYDTVTAAVRWDATESSPGAATYISAQATPASHALPNSFYLSSRPGFFTTPQGVLPFPLIGPDVTNGKGGYFSGGTYARGICPVGLAAGGVTCSTAVGGFANVNPAMNCYFNVMSGPADGSGPAIAFDSNSCYSSGTAPPSVTLVSGSSLTSTPH